MEKRIKIVWILSLLSALVLIIVQGYWLLNQYEYTINAYSEEVKQHIWKATEEEYLLRKKEKAGSYTYVVSTKDRHESSGDSTTGNKQYSFAISFLDSIGSQSAGVMDMDSLKKIQREYIDQALDGMEKDPLEYYNQKDSLDQPPPSGLRLQFGKNLSMDSLYLGIDRSVVNFVTPFRQETLDSILSASLPGVSYLLRPLIEEDSSTSHTLYSKTGSLLDPKILTVYHYSPLEKKALLIQVNLPIQPVFKRMILQLMLSIALILLLIGCLILQIKTILKQRKLNELRQNFVNTMIHELKRPVQTLKTFLAFLSDREMRTNEIQTEEILQDSMFELDNLTVYLNKLKDMVRADDTNTPLTLVKFDLQELVGRVIRLTNIPEGKEVRFSTEFDMESPFIEADPVHVANIVSNLIENAVKYSVEQVDIQIKATRKGHELWLTVSDNGIGIPLIDQDKVFAKFYRGSNLPDQNIPGLGLGLSYVKLISEAHRGYVSLQSRIGEGTSITLFLPQ